MAKSASKIFQVLEAITNFTGKPRLVDLQTLLPFPKASLHRYLYELLEMGLIRKSLGDNRYAPGYVLLNLAKKCVLGSELVQSADRPLKDLHIDTGETVSLFVWHDYGAICVKQFQSSHPIRSNISLGDKISCTTTSAGKILLSYHGTADNLEIPPELLEELRHIHQQGYTIDNEQAEEGFISLSVPVFDTHQTIIAVLSISYPIIRIPDNFKTEILSKLLITSASITSKIKYFLN